MTLRKDQDLTKRFQFRYPFVHASSQLCPLGKLVLGTCAEQFSLSEQELCFELSLFRGQGRAEKAKVDGINLGEGAETILEGATDVPQLTYQVKQNGFSYP